MPNCTMGQKSTFSFFLKIQSLLKSTIWERPLALVMKDFFCFRIEIFWGQFRAFLFSSLVKFWLHLFPHFPQFFASLWRMMETFLRHDIMMGHCLWLQGFCTSKALFTLEFYKLFCEWSLSKCTIWQALQKCTRVSSHQNEEQFLKYVTVLSNCKIRTFIQKEQILAQCTWWCF